MSVRGRGSFRGGRGKGGNFGANMGGSRDGAKKGHVKGSSNIGMRSMRGIGRRMDDDVDRYTEWPTVEHNEYDYSRDYEIAKHYDDLDTHGERLVYMGKPALERENIDTKIDIGRKRIDGDKGFRREEISYRRDEVGFRKNEKGSGRPEREFRKRGLNYDSGRDICPESQKQMDVYDRDRFNEGYSSQVRGMPAGYREIKPGFADSYERLDSGRDLPIHSSERDFREILSRPIKNQSDFNDFGERQMVLNGPVIRKEPFVVRGSQVIREDDLIREQRPEDFSAAREGPMMRDIGVRENTSIRGNVSMRLGPPIHMREDPVLEENSLRIMNPARITSVTEERGISLNQGKFESNGGGRIIIPQVPMAVGGIAGGATQMISQDGSTVFYLVNDIPPVVTTNIRSETSGNPQDIQRVHKDDLRKYKNDMGGGRTYNVNDPIRVERARDEYGKGDAREGDRNKSRYESRDHTKESMHGDRDRNRDRSFKEANIERERNFNENRDRDCLQPGDMNMYRERDPLMKQYRHSDRDIHESYIPDSRDRFISPARERDLSRTKPRDKTLDNSRRRDTTKNELRKRETVLDKFERDHFDEEPFRTRDGAFVGRDRSPLFRERQLAEPVDKRDHRPRHRDRSPPAKIRREIHNERQPPMDDVDYFSPTTLHHDDFKISRKRPIQLDDFLEPEKLRDSRVPRRREDDGPLGQRFGPPRTGPSRSSPQRSGPHRSGQSRSGPHRSSPQRSGPPRTGPHRSSPPRSGPPRSGPPRSGPPRSSPLRSGPPRSSPSRSGPLAKVNRRPPPERSMRNDINRPRRRDLH